jgi:SPP1 family predicted phage head-tail adaptor
MQAGRLRHRIDVDQNVGTEDAAGQLIPSWEAWLENEPAEVIESGGAESLRGFAIAATATVIVRVRYRAGYEEEMRIRFGSRVFGIVNVRDIDGRSRELWLSCQERKS